MAMGTAQAAGVVALAAAQHDVPVRFHTPSEVKAAVTGSGRADKAQVTTMVTRILGMQTRPTPADAADRARAGDLSVLARTDGRPSVAAQAKAESWPGCTRTPQGGARCSGEGRPMIAAVRGPVIDVALDHVVVDCAGVGYRVLATPATIATLTRGIEATLLTTMIVREDLMTLYGFTDGAARDLFCAASNGDRGGAAAGDGGPGRARAGRAAAALACRTSPRSPRCRASASERPSG